MTADNPFAPPNTPSSAPAATGTPDAAQPSLAHALTGQRAHHRRRWMLPSALAALIIAFVAAFTVPVNAVIESPGPTWNVLGSVDGLDNSDPVISVTGTQTYETSGALRMTTVAVRGCPGYPVTAADVITSWLSAREEVVPREAVCPKSMTAEQVSNANQAQMSSSESAAIVAALLETGQASRMILTVAGLNDQQKNADLKEGDILASLTLPDGTTTEISSYDQLRAQLTRIDPGTRLELGITRDGEASSASVTTIAPDDADGDGQPDAQGSLLGVYLTIEADSPVKASFGLQDVGGPSAGMMFALGIVDEITPGEMTGGVDIAGTGTISADGTVGAIGGIAQKMQGAFDSGSRYFLAPVDNCSEVIGHEPDGMQVFAVSTLHEAVEAVEAIGGGNTSNLSTCDALMNP